MDYRIREIISTMKMLDDYAISFGQAHLDDEAVHHGLEVSANACSQKEFVFATPLMKNLLVVMGDVSQREVKGQWKTEKLKAGTKSKAVTWIDQVVHAALKKFNGPEKTVYDHNLPVDSVELYNTDCWLGWNIEKFWDIKPGQADERKRTFSKYSNPKTNYSKDQMINALSKDDVLQGVVVHFLKHWPVVKANWRVEEINDPFMSKKTGVSYPFFQNDSTTVPGTNITYGKHCIDIVSKAAKQGINGLVKLAKENNVYTGYPRNQRGKGRALEAQSRIVNLIVNMINGNEMEEVKHSEYGAGLVPQEELKQRLIEIAEFVLEHPDYIAINKDFTGWDTTVGYGWVLLQNALRYLNANGSLAKELVKIRHACVSRSQLINGPEDKVQLLFGRTPSGYVDTTLQNCSVNNIQCDYANRVVDENYTQNVTYPMRNKNILVLGDDYLGITKKGKEKEWVQVTGDKGFEAHADFKDAFGVMFVQYRLFKYEGEWVMTYNWPRVLRSMLSKEDQKSLGKGGWTLSFYQQLGKLIEYKPALTIALNIAAALDKDHLMLNTDVREIIKMVRQEDEEYLNAQTKGKSRKKTRFLTTAERLSNNPMLPGVKKVNGKIELDDNYFVTVQQALKECYDPEFLIKLGFSNPDLAKVH